MSIKPKKMHENVFLQARRTQEQLAGISDSAWSVAELVNRIPKLPRLDTHTTDMISRMKEMQPTGSAAAMKGLGELSGASAMQSFAESARAQLSMCQDRGLGTMVEALRSPYFEQLEESQKRMNALMKPLVGLAGVTKMASATEMNGLAGRQDTIRDTIREIGNYRCPELGLAPTPTLAEMRVTDPQYEATLRIENELIESGQREETIVHELVESGKREERLGQELRRVREIAEEAIERERRAERSAVEQEKSKRRWQITSILIGVLSLLAGIVALL